LSTKFATKLATKFLRPDRMESNREVAKAAKMPDMEIRPTARAAESGPKLRFRPYRARVLKFFEVLNISRGPLSSPAIVHRNKEGDRRRS